MVADDTPIIRDVLKTIIEQSGCNTVVGLAGNGREAAEICTLIRPDLVLMDLKMPVCDGVEGTRLIKDADSTIKVVILTTFDDREYLEKAFAYGADGYVFKDISDEELLRTIEKTADRVR